MKPGKTTSKTPILTVLLLCLTYFVFEQFFNSFSMITVDEFWFAHKAYQYKDHLPYRDFAPYKTVLGYYFLLLPILFGKGVVGTLVFTKNMIALLNALLLGLSTVVLARFFNLKAALTSLTVLLFSDVLLSYSTNIRVDLFAYWCGFWGSLALLQGLNKNTLRWFITSAILFGLGFCISQKIIWYIGGANFALISNWYLYQHRHTHHLINILFFNMIIIGIIGAYILLFAWLSDFQTVFHSIFLEASAMYQLDWYAGNRSLFWGLTLLLNPLIFLLAPFTLISLFITFPNDRGYQSRLFALIFALSVLCFLIPYKQVFLYYMQVMILPFLMLYTAFFAWVYQLFNTAHADLIFKISHNKIVGGIGLYIATIFTVIMYFALPSAYFLILTIPFALGYFTILQKSAYYSLSILLLSMIFIGVIYHLPLFIKKTQLVNSHYQKANIEKMAALLQNGGDYVAGIELLYNASQPIAGLKHLMGPAISYLSHPDNKLRAVMLPALDEDANANIASILTDLRNSNVKLYVNNYRMMNLPLPLRTYLAKEYAHYWGSIYLYAPTITPDLIAYDIKFTGKYMKVSAQNKKQVLFLKKGSHINREHSTFRLYLQPEANNDNALPDEWSKITI